MGLFREILHSLNEQQVSYVVVGGLAVVFHGRARLTLDMDLVIRLEEQNIRKVVKILLDHKLKARIPADPAGFADPKIRQKWIDEKGMMVFSFRDPTNSISGVDIFASYPMDFDLMLSRSVLGLLEGTQVRMVGLDDLIDMKREAGRKIDLEDLHELEIIRNAKQ